MGGSGIGKTWLSTLAIAFSNFAIQYNFGSIAIALLMMSDAVCTQKDASLCRKGEQQSWVQGTSSSVIFVGAVIGQLVMGRLGDLIGRNKALLVTTGIATVAAALQAIAPAGSPSSIYAVIILFRFFLGVGVGGVYPLSATKAVEDAGGGPATEEDEKESESHASKTKGAVASAIGFFWQMPGMMGPYFVSLGLANSPAGAFSIDTQWRLLLGLGAVPSAITMICLALELHYQRPVQTAPAGAEKVEDVIPRPTQPLQLTSLEIVKMIYSDAGVRRKLAATGLCWFFFDVLNYGIGLISPEILAKITHDTGDITSPASIRELSTLTLGTMALSFPGTLLTIYLLPSLGIKRLQVWGFAILASFCLLLGCVFQPLANDEQALFGIYCLVCIAMSFGIAVSTYTLPALVFERDKRATMNGVCAAMGKCGAVVGSYSFGSIARSSSSGFTIVLLLCFASASVSTVISQVYIDVPLPVLSCCSSSTSPHSPSSNEEADESLSVSEIEVISVIHDN